MKKGSITIYISIILVSVILVVSVISESARVSVVQSQSKAFTYMAADSVMAQYARQIYEDYGILLVWENESVKEQMKNYIQANINMADLNVKGSNFMGTNLLDLKIQEIEYVTENGGENLIKQIGEYVKYSELLKAAGDLTEWFNAYKEGSETYNPKKEDVTDIVDKSSEELQKYIKKIEKDILKLKDTNKLQEKLEAVSQIVKDKVENLSKENHKKSSRYLKLITELEKKADEVDSAIKQIEKYKEKKAQFFEKYEYTTDVRDYIDDNLIILENIRDEIIRIKALDISKKSEIESENMSSMQEAMQKTKLVVDNLKSLKINKATDEDKKNQSIYETAKTFIKDGFLSLVLDDVSDISNASILDSNLPTNLINQNRNKSILKNTKDRAVITVYARSKFGNYLNEQKETSLKYEMEYIINGKYNDKDNLLGTIEKLVGIRNLLNIAYLVTDSEKMTEISAVALSASMAIGLPFMESIIKAILIEAWSLAEAVNDVKILLDGSKVSLVKTKRNWKTSLNNLTKTQDSDTEKGLDYMQYCELLIMLQNGDESIYRIMDLMQVNIQKRYNKDFLMNKCFFGLSLTSYFETKQLFTAMPWAISLLNNNAKAYEYEIDCVYGY